MELTSTMNTVMAMNGPAWAASVGDIEILSTNAPSDMATPAAIQSMLGLKNLLRCSSCSFDRNLEASATTLTPLALSILNPPGFPDADNQPYLQLCEI